jgi:hypothetical protein
VYPILFLIAFSVKCVHFPKYEMGDNVVVAGYHGEIVDSGVTRDSYTVLFKNGERRIDVETYEIQLCR